ncbi:PE family protein, partial [Mycobacterium conspicuum]|uniref:PE family protein n=1 Tax=Mycobacterium conspicuum TaxID=44010 RepID=UPI00111C83AB
MSSVVAVPGLIDTATRDLASLGTTIRSANAAAATPTTGLLAAAEDEVSAAIAEIFSAHGRGFQAASAQAGAFHSQFVQTLTAGAQTYVSTEAANVAAFAAHPAQAAQQHLLNAINAPSLALTGRPLIGNGANGAPGTGENGAPGGWLYGNGGAGGSGANGTGQNGGNGGAAGLWGYGGAGGDGRNASVLFGDGGVGGAGGLGATTGGDGGHGGNGALFTGNGSAGGAGGMGTSGTGGHGGHGGTSGLVGS